MLVEVYSEIEAQRLTNLGYTRAGSKAIETNLSDLDDLLEMENVSVKKVSLRRENGPEEANVIDDLIDQGYEDRVKEVTGLRTSVRSMSQRTTTVFNLGANSVTIHKDFRDIINGDVTELNVDKGRYEAVTDEIQNKINSKIAELEEEIEKKEERRDQIQNTSFEEWVEQGGPKL